MYYPCSENKGADQLRGTARLICVFVFAYAKNGFLTTRLILYLFYWFIFILSTCARQVSIMHFVETEIGRAWHWIGCVIKYTTLNPKFSDQTLANSADPFIRKEEQPDQRMCCLHFLCILCDLNNIVVVVISNLRVI